MVWVKNYLYVAHPHITVWGHFSLYIAHPCHGMWLFISRYGAISFDFFFSWKFQNTRAQIYPDQQYNNKKKKHWQKHESNKKTRKWKWVASHQLLFYRWRLDVTFGFSLGDYQRETFHHSKTVIVLTLPIDFENGPSCLRISIASWGDTELHTPSLSS